ncbi:MAG: type II secretion system F family protein [Acidimicrobiaceae bacterium]|nr:type II secretion system F family protein [Acidimicrobiia bacterium]MCY4494289.1 type II secretion system F family protein [Acidimicrobiaceae bacterium]
MRRVDAARARRRRRLAAIAQLPEMLDVLARELRGGRNLHEAIQAASSLPSLQGLGLDTLVARFASGERLVEALDRWAGELDHPDGDLVRAVVSLGSVTGGALAGSMERAALTLRERAGLVDEVRVLTAQTRASAMVLFAAPIGFLVLLLTLDPSSSAAVFTTGTGQVCVAAGLLLDAVGFAWMRRLAASVTR